MTAAPLSIGDAMALIASRIEVLPTEKVELVEACGRFLAEDLRAEIDLPPFANSSMDGYALRARDTPCQLSVVGESAAGSPFLGRLGVRQAVEISTGSAIPAGADAVVPLERVTRAGADGDISVRSVQPGACVRASGGDVRSGDRLLEAGIWLGPAQIGAAAAVGRGMLRCHRQPTVALLTTGSELRQPGQRLAEGEIFDANGPMLHAALRTSGASVVHLPAAADTRPAHRTALESALKHDVVISTGGVSIGAHDLVRSVGRELGIDEVFWRVALRPGKPLAFGTKDHTLVFGLPGNPVSALVCFELFIRPALLALQGARGIQPDWRRGFLATAVRRNTDRDELIRVRTSARDIAGKSTGDRTILTPLASQQSHQIAITAQADGLALISAGAGVTPAGGEVAYLLLKRA